MLVEDAGIFTNVGEWCADGTRRNGKRTKMHPGTF